VWPTKLIQCLLDIKIAVAEAANEGLSSLSEEQLNQFNEQYDEILAQGKAEIPILPATKIKKRGKPKRHKSHNLHARLVDHKAEVLGFMNDFFLPFDNNLAERDIRMAKLKRICSLYWHLRFIRYLNSRMACIRPVVWHQEPKQGFGKTCEL